MTPIPKGAIAKNRINMIGFKSNMLEVIDYWDTKKRTARWLCVCDCGNLSIKHGYTLRKASDLGCGCNVGKFNITHGQTDTPTWFSWRVMRHRVKYSQRYKDISICSRWDKFENFFKDMGERPDGFTLKRINPFGNYEPDNCKWALLENKDD